MTPEEYRDERNRALSVLDMDWARRMMPTATSDAVRLVAMHKARYEALGVNDDLRHKSRAWLEARNLTRLGGLPWPDSELPRS